jgi:hypothetical protein
VLPTTSAPVCWIAARTDGSFSEARIAAFKVCTTAVGVPLGATTPEKS